MKSGNITLGWVEIVILKIEEKELFEIIHGKGPYACCKRAFYWDHKPIRGEIIDAKYAVYENYAAPANGENMICDSCGRQINIFEIYPRDGFADED